jgi:hypothetical protein
MDESRQREIARKGGKAAHQRGTAHEFTREEAAEAGRKGGKAVSQNRQHMAEIGRKGGKAAHQRGAPPLAESAARQDQHTEDLLRQEEHAAVPTEPTPERGSAQRRESGAAEAAEPGRNGNPAEHGNGHARNGNGQQSVAAGQPAAAGAE